MKQRDLLDDGTPARKPSPKYTDAQRLTAFYRNEYKRMFGELPVVEIYDGKALKNLAQTFGYETVQSRITEYLRWDNDYAAEQGYPLWLLRRKWNQLASHLLKRSRNGGDDRMTCAHRPRCGSAAEHTKKRLMELRTK